MWWKSFTFEEGLWYGWNCGGAGIFICREGKNWQSVSRSIRWDRRNSSITGPVREEPPFMTALQKDILGRKTAALRPYFPEKPFLVNLSGLKLFPGMKTTFNLRLPPDLRLVAEKTRDPDQIFSFSLFELKESWYGTNTMEGVLCTSLPLDEQAAPGSFGIEIHCSIIIRNKTKTVLEMDKIPLYAAGLSVYEKNGKLTSDTLLIDALEHSFRITSETVKNENTTLLAQGQRQELDFIHGAARTTKIIERL